jgi:hypothetical protein
MTEQPFKKHGDPADEILPGRDEDQAGGVPVPGAGGDAEEAHGGSLVGPDEGSTTGR